MPDLLLIRCGTVLTEVNIKASQSFAETCYHKLS